MEQTQLDRLFQIEREIKALARKVMDGILADGDDSRRVHSLWHGKAVGQLEAAADAVIRAAITCRVAFDLKEPQLETCALVNCHVIGPHEHTVEGPAQPAETEGAR